MDLQSIRKKYITGKQDSVLSEKICNDCGLESYMSMYKIVHLMYHTDTYFNDVYQGWRLQGYVFVEDLLDTDISIPECEVSVSVRNGNQHKEIMLYFTKFIENKK